MGMVILVVVMLALLLPNRIFTGTLPGRWHRPPVATPRTPPGTAPPALTTPSEIERRVTARLMDGTLDGPSYRVAMAALAAHAPSELSVPTMLAERARLARAGELVGRLGLALPELGSGTVLAAVNLARCGADTDELIRLLHLTGPQAMRISTALAGTDHPA